MFGRIVSVSGTIGITCRFCGRRPSRALVIIATSRRAKNVILNAKECRLRTSFLRCRHRDARTFDEGVTTLRRRGKNNFA